MNNSSEISLISTEINAILKSRSLLRSSNILTESISENHLPFTKTIQTGTQFQTRKTYDETFDTDNESSESKQTKSFSYSSSEFSSQLDTSPFQSTHNSESTEYNHDETFETLSESSIDSDESFLDGSNKKDFEKLRETDYVRYIKIKCKKEKRSKNKSIQKNLYESENFNKSQIEKLIRKAKKSSESRNVTKDKDPYLEMKINSELVNKLTTINSIQRIKAEQLKKIERLGQDIQLDFLYNHQTRELDDNQSSLLPIKNITKGVYFQNKIDRINNKLIEQRIVEHEAFYSDGIVMIGDLASTLPRHSDPPEIIWNELMKPLNE